MHINIRGHETTVLPRWREHVNGRMAKLSGFSQRLISVDVYLTSSHHHLKGDESCQITGKVPGKTLSVRRDAETMIEAIDAACKVFERQVRALWKDVKTRSRHNKQVRALKRGTAG